MSKTTGIQKSHPSLVTLEEGPLGRSEIRRLSEFRQLLNTRIQVNPRDILQQLGNVLQNKGLTFRQRKRIFQEITRKIIKNPSSPYYRLEKEVQEDMINSISGVLADAPVVLPKVG